mgnify:FL=1
MDSHRVRVFAHPSVRAALAAFIESRAPPSVSFDYADTGLCEHASLDAVSPGPPEAAAAEEGGSSAPPLTYFDVAEFGSALETETLGRTLLYAQTIDSTQTLLRDGLWGVDPSWGAICLAESQVKGAGRGGNTWSSPPGCLLFSFHSQFNSGRSLPFVQYMISLAVIQAIEGTTRAGGSGGGDARRLPIHIKWPNDIYADLGALGGAAAAAKDEAASSRDGAAASPEGSTSASGSAGMVKIGGILCNSSSMMSGVFDVVTGVGFNVWNDEPTTSLRAIVDAANDAAEPSSAAPWRCPSSAALVAAFLGHFEALKTQFDRDGFSSFEDEYYARWLHSGQSVVVEPHGRATISGISHTTGALIAAASRPGGGDETLELFPDGNSFDFMRGLVSKKKK